MNPPLILPRTTLIWLPILALSLAGAAACGEPASSASETGEMQIRGRVLEVVARNITEVETLRLPEHDGGYGAFLFVGTVGITGGG